MNEQATSSARTIGIKRATLAIVFAGGSSRRFGIRNKALEIFKGRSLIGHVTDRLSAQCAKTAISLNRNRSDNDKLLDQVAKWQPLVTYDGEPSLGPISGLAAGLELAHKLELDYLMSAPCDVPLLPDNLVERCFAEIDGPRSASRQQVRPVVIASYKSRQHYTIGLWPVETRASVKRLLLTDYPTVAGPSLQRLLETLPMRTASFDDHESDPFLNINRPTDLADWVT